MSVFTAVLFLHLAVRLPFSSALELDNPFNFKTLLPPNNSRVSSASSKLLHRFRSRYWRPALSVIPLSAFLAMQQDGFRSLVWFPSRSRWALPDLPRIRRRFHPAMNHFARAARRVSDPVLLTAIRSGSAGPAARLLHGIQAAVSESGQFWRAQFLAY
jgi:hypothetical protein